MTAITNRSLLTCLLVSALVCVFGHAATADARRAPVCAKKGGKTLAATKHARVFRKRFQVYACLRRGRRAFVLGTNRRPHGDDQVADLRLRGRFVAYSFRRSWSARVRVKELRGGRTVHNAGATVIARPGFAELADLELKHNGSVAWIAKTDPIDVPLMLYPQPIDYLPFWEVNKSDRAGRRLLDMGRDIGRSLLLRGGTIYWWRAGRIRAARLD